MRNCRCAGDKFLALLQELGLIDNCCPLPNISGNSFTAAMNEPRRRQRGIVRSPAELHSGYKTTVNNLRESHLPPPPQQFDLWLWWNLALRA